jgi:dihydrofolate reductase
MNYNVIMATDKYGGYAKNGAIPWNIPNELKYFNSITTYKEGKLTPIVIMGRRTWQSIPNTPLPNRINVILSTSMDNTKTNGYYVFNNLQKLINFLSEKFFFNEKYIIGGHKIINDFFVNNNCIINKIYISQINENYECDQFLNISDHLLEYNYMSYSKLMHDRIKKKEVSIIFKKFYNKNIENPNYDIFYIEDEKIKLLRIYYNDTPNIIKIRQTLPDRILNLLDKNVYNTMYHGKYI